MAKRDTYGIIIGESPIEYATKRMRYWQDRLKLACKKPVGKNEFDGFRSMAEKQYEETRCRGAIEALKEIVLAPYSIED